MAEIKVFGYSDDMIEVETKPYMLTGGSEFDASSGPNYLAFSDGTVLRVRFDEGGVWRVSAGRKGAATYEHDKTGWDEVDGFTERVTLTGNITWVNYCGDDEGAAVSLATSGGAVEKAFDVFEVLEKHSDFDGFWREVDAEDRTRILVGLAEMLTA